VLRRDDTGAIPAWTGSVSDVFESSACIQVTEDAPATTTTLRCTNEGVSPEAVLLDIPGMRVAGDSLSDILGAIGLADVPIDGLTLGIVLDENDSPASGATITVDQPGKTIEIINANRTGIVPGNTTTASGLFISRDATYGAAFGASLITPLKAQIGGRVRNKLTIVLFQQGTIGG
jgi:hypothetical protein